LVAAYLQQRHEIWWAHLAQRLTDAASPKALTVFDAYLDHNDLDTDRGCAFLNAAAELPADHPGVAVIREHKRAVRDKLAELVRVDAPHAEDPDALAEELFLLLEGAVTHIGIDGDSKRMRTAKRIASAHIEAQG
ncbi:MAG: TetR/AcrR family transcriptional regulator, partial [Actinophytocola sp.]|nr:TetR/AcrR family transcriptional regulator [Actinophytocola sp.]